MSYARLGIFAATVLFPWALPVGALQVAGPARQYKGILVPAVRDSTQQWAEDRIGKVGLNTRVQQVVTTSAQPGTVVRQSPAPDTRVPLGSEVLLIVAAVPPTQSITMPYLIDLTRNQASQKLESLGLNGRGILALAPSKVGLVIQQEPDSGTPLKKGAPVRFWYGQAGPPPPEQVRVPDVRHGTLGEARSKAQAIGLQIAADDPVGIGDAALVVAQRPVPDELVSRGASLQVKVVAPPIVVPNVVGRLQQDAEDTMRRAGLRPRSESHESSHQPPGTVVSQSLSPGSAVAPNSEVVLSVTRPPPPPDTGRPLPPPPPQGVEMPNVLGRQVDSALATLTLARLRVTSVDTTEREGGAGLVDVQDPSAGTYLAFGAPVSITVAVPLKPDVVTHVVAGGADSAAAQPPDTSAKPTPDTAVSPPVKPTVKKSGEIARVRVPPLVGLTRTEAIVSLGRSWLLPGVILWATDSGATAKVIGQKPPPNTKVPREARVDMTLAVPTPPPVIVPPVVGLAPDSAEALLALVTLRAERRDTSVGFAPGGVVERQAPRAGDSVRPGTAVQVLVGRRVIPWMLIVSCVVGVGAAAAFAWKLAHDNGRTPEHEAPLPVLGLDPRVGDGKNEMGSDQERAAGHELQFAAATGAATQRVDGDETFIRERP